MIVPQRGRMLIPIDVYLDFVCPWCYLQTRSLRAATDAFVAAHPEVEFHVTWRPFYVAPTAAPNAPHPAPATARLRAAATRHNLPPTLGADLHVVGPTRSAHKLVALALRRGGRAAQSRMVERLLHARLVDGLDVSDPTTLVALAARPGLFPSSESSSSSSSSGLLPEDVMLELADDDADRRVDREVERAREDRGIEAVPCATVLGRFMVGGYQEPEVFGDLFRKIYEEKICEQKIC